MNTTIAEFDFETYSEAGFVFNPSTNKYQCLPNASKKGLPAIGVACYAEHPSTELLCMAYDLKDGKGPRLWRPGDVSPHDLFIYLINGGLLEAWNVAFEYWIWTKVCERKYGWPPLPVPQLRCAMAKSRAFALPGSLKNAGEVLNISAQKDKRGTRLLNKYSMPRNPTKTNSLRRILPNMDDPDTIALYEYNIRDIEAECEISARIPDLSTFELKFWQCDQAINRRGIKMDLASINNCIVIVEAAYVKYNAELQQITKGAVRSASEVAKILKWIYNRGVIIDSLEADVLEEKLNSEIPFAPDIRRVLQIRSLIGSAAVKKLYAMKNQIASDDRLHDLFSYHSARTGRAAGAGVQPQNLPNSGPDVIYCNSCHIYFSTNVPLKKDICYWCSSKDLNTKDKWDINAVEWALDLISRKELAAVEFYLDNAIATVSGCLRSLFISEEGKDLICSDYSAIEAVVLAALAGEQWRLDVFNDHGKIYEMSASKITGIPFEEFEKYELEHKQSHPMRKKIGKVAELASGYQGGVAAWKVFGAGEFFSDEEIKQKVKMWRDASPAIVEFWGGQKRNYRNEYYGVEGAAVQAVLDAGNEYDCRGIKFIVKEDILYCTLLSGRSLVYHKPRITPSMDWRSPKLSYEGWNSNIKMGAPGWTRIDTFGGRLVENIVQATARDILAFAIVNLEEAGYPVVLHVHDEIVSEVPENFGSIEEFEKIMSTMPEWAKGWPVVAKKGWRGKRYRK